MPVLTEKEYTRLRELREELFEKNWDTKEFKAMLRDQVV